MEEEKAVVWRAVKVAVPVLLLALLTFVVFTSPYALPRGDASFAAWQEETRDVIGGKMAAAREKGVYDDYGLLPGHSQQVGLQGQAYALLDKVLGRPRSIESIAALLNSLLLGGTCLLVCAWMGKELNRLAGLLCFGAAVFSPWFTAVGANLYLALWTLLLPFVMVLYLFWRPSFRQKKHFQVVAGLVLFFVSFLRFCCGFEYASVVLVSMQVPLVYYAVAQKWGFKKYSDYAITVGGLSVFAFAAAFGVNFVQQVAHYGSFETASVALMETIGKWTGLLYTGTSAPYRQALDAPLPQLLGRMLLGPGVLFGVNVLVLLGGFALVWLAAGLGQKGIPGVFAPRRKIHGLGLAGLLSLLGPLSWLLLAKGHSVLHQPMLLFLWLAPCALLLCGHAGAVLGYVARALLEPRLPWFPWPREEDTAESYKEKGPGSEDGKQGSDPENGLDPVLRPWSAPLVRPPKLEEKLSLAAVSAEEAMAVRPPAEGWLEAGEGPVSEILTDAVLLGVAFPGPEKPDAAPAVPAPLPEQEGEDKPCAYYPAEKTSSPAKTPAGENSSAPPPEKPGLPL